MRRDDIEYYDFLETRDPLVREAELFASLPEQIEIARQRAPQLARILGDLPSAEIASRVALARLPVLRKSDLMELQKRAPPFGGLATVSAGQTVHVFASPGPIYELEGRDPDFAGLARALFAAGFRRGDLLYNTFSYHFTPAGLMFEAGARALGCAVFPAGVGQTELQAATIADLRPQGYVGTPSFLKIVLEKGRELGCDHSSLKKALVSGEALPGTLKAAFEEQGLRVSQAYMTADLGLIAYESEARDGLIVNEGILVEIVRPGTGDPVPEGEVGEVVVTSLRVPEYPLLRFATGDLSAVLPGTSPCGRTNMRVRGWLGRADQSAKVRGLFVHPSLIARILSRHPEILRARLVVRREEDEDQMTLRCETGSPPAEGLAHDVALSIREVCKLRGEVELLPAGSLPNDGKIIEDTRPV